MYNLNLYISNRLEILAEQLARILRKPSSEPMSPEIIVVQSRGMQRWISLELAALNGVCANVSFPFPNTFLENIIGKFDVELPHTSLFDPDVLVFRMMKILPTCIDRKGFGNIKSYLADDPYQLKLFQLSGKIADIFDQYLIFRPEMILDWEAGRETGRGESDRDTTWQATLWRELVRDEQVPHRAHLQQKILDKVRQGSTGSDNLPARAAVFGVSYLPLFHLITLAELSKLMEINFFLLNPCREYWADIASEKEIKRIRKKFSLAEEPAEFLHLEQGNRLLASMGILGRNFFSLINHFEIESHELYEDPADDSMLGCIQSDILNLRNRVSISATSEKETDPPGPFGDEDDTKPVTISPHDSSIQVHACHSPMREVEVQFDNILAMFEADPDLQPGNIIVMAPDIEKYAPYIHAVFGAQTDPALRIPYSIADQSARRESRLIDGFLSILDLKDSRFSSSQVMGLLSYQPIRDKFGINDSDIGTIERWVQDTRIRWGIDEHTRIGFGLPGYPQNTWQAGFERLLLGYAMPGGDDHLFDGILPYDRIEGSDIRVLGKFLEFTQRLFKIAGNLDQPKSLIDWRQTFVSILQQFFLADPEAEREMQILRSRLDQLVRCEEISDYSESLELEVVRSYLKKHLESPSFGSGFITGGVTFCSMLPMRSIPFDVICLLGMNADAFPRDDRPLTFDLIANQPKIGDRSRRNDDKYLFLEALLSARKKFYISYVGQSIRDNARIPPSVVVEELIENIQESFETEKGGPPKQIVTHHRLQPFSDAYFKEDARLYSYSEENMIAAARRQEPYEHKPFIFDKLPIPDDEIEIWQHIDLEPFCFFFSNPVRFLLKQRLDIRLDRKTHLWDENEHFELNHLERYLIGEEFIRKQLAGINPDDFEQILKASGTLPHGSPGEVQFDDIRVDVEEFVRKIDRVAHGYPGEPINVEIDLSDYKLSGHIADIHNNGIVHFRYAKTRAKDLIRTWIYHLACCQMQPFPEPANSYLICKDAVWQFTPISEPADELKRLLDVYWQGLSEPIHFFSGFGPDVHPAIA